MTRKSSTDRSRDFFGKGPATLHKRGRRPLAARPAVKAAPSPAGITGAADGTLRLETGPALLTRFSRELEALQARLGDLHPDVKIIVIDPDLADFRDGLSEFFDNGAPPGAGAILEVIRRHAGAEYYPGALRLGNLAERVATGHPGVEFLDPRDAQGRHVAVVLLTSRDLGPRAAQNLFLDISPDLPSPFSGLADPRAHEPLLAGELLHRFIDAHEIAHLRDRRLVELMKRSDNHARMTDHLRAEMFADTRAALELAAEGAPEVAAAVADLRAIWVAACGPIQPMVTEWNTVPALDLAARRIAEMGPAAIAALDAGGRDRLAAEIVAAAQPPEARKVALYGWFLRCRQHYGGPRPDLAAHLADMGREDQQAAVQAVIDRGQAAAARIGARPELPDPAPGAMLSELVLEGGALASWAAMVARREELRALRDQTPAAEDDYNQALAGLGKLAREAGQRLGRKLRDAAADAAPPPAAPRPARAPKR